MATPSSRWLRSFVLAVTVVAPSLALGQPATQAPPTEPPPTPRTQPPPDAMPSTLEGIAPSPIRLERAGQREDQTVRAPDVPPTTEPPPILREKFPAVREGLDKLPPFFRDTDLNLHFRSFYFNRQSDDGTASEALALGGWLQYVSGWLFDTFRAGATYYMSFPLYAPESRSGTLLLTPGRDEIGVLGEAWGALRYKDYALLKGYRERIDEGYINSQDNRMVPNTFEAVTLSGKLDWVRYDVGYIWNIKPRDSNDFISMSKQAGASGDSQGVILSTLTLTPIKDLTIYLANYYGRETFNTAYGKAEYAWNINKDLKWQFGVQGTDQRSVGEERIRDFTTWNVGAGTRVVWRGLSLGFATHFTGDGDSIRTPWGTWPGYLSLQVTDFDRANEKAFGTGVKYDFSSDLLPFQIPGLTLQMIYGQGNDRIDPISGKGQATTYEGDLDIIYNVPAVKGLSLRFRNAYVGRGNADVLKEFRLIINYEFNLL